jgi:hypothetical protein
MTDAVITDHADDRMRKRLGLPRKALDKQAAKALEKGATHADFSGSFRRYLDGVFLSERNASNMRIHAGHLYLFKDETLITCWALPPKFRSVKPRTS